MDAISNLLLAYVSYKDNGQANVLIQDTSLRFSAKASTTTQLNGCDNFADQFSKDVTTQECLSTALGYVCPPG